MTVGRNDGSAEKNRGIPCKNDESAAPNAVHAWLNRNYAGIRRKFAADLFFGPTGVLTLREYDAFSNEGS